jgi:hypothetical protein
VLLVLPKILDLVRMCSYPRQIEDQCGAGIETAPAAVAVAVFETVATVFFGRIKAIRPKNTVLDKS